MVQDIILHRIKSAIDLTITSATIASIRTWEVLNQLTVGSDHYPIIIKIGIELNQERGGRTPRSIQ